MTETSEHDLPAAMAGFAAWMPEFRSALQALLTSRPREDLAIADLLDSVAPRLRTTDSVSELVDHIASHFTAHEVYNAWQRSEGWAAVVRTPKLSSLIGRAGSWTVVLQIQVHWWLYYHATLSEVKQLAALTGLQAEAAPFGESDPIIDLLLKKRPKQLLAAWQQVRSKQASSEPDDTGRSIRQWAKAHGFVIGKRGRLPLEVVRRYEEAVGKG